MVLTHRLKRSTRASRGAGAGFAGRLMAAQALVLIASALTTWLVAAVIAPSIFHDHLQQAGVSHASEETDHVEQAFSSALLISLVVALMAAFVAALAVSWYLSRRVRRSISPVTASAADLAGGKYDSRVPDPGLGGEFAMLSATFNALAERLDAVESARRRMLSDLAHEMRTPLATIDAHLEAVEDGVRALDEPTLDTIRRSTRRLHRLAEDIGTISSAQEGRLKIRARLLDGAVLARDAIEVVADQYAAKSVRLRSHTDPDVTVRADSERIGQILGNLLDNALRHTPKGGEVTLSCTRQGPWVEYAVSDNGVGIEAEHLPHLFDRFYRVDTARDRRHGGSGSGMRIARALTEAHGGSIAVRSDGDGRGATFTVRLALADE